METSVEELSPISRKLKVSVPYEDVRKEMDAAYDKIKKDLTIPGFRRGKAPKSIVELRLGNSLQDEAVKALLSRASKEAFAEHKISPVSEPVVENLRVEKDSPLTFELKVEVVPDFDLPEYSNLKIPAARIEPVTDEDVQKELEFLRMQHATYVPVEGRAVAEKDFVTVEYTEEIDGNKTHNKNWTVQLGDEKILPDLEQNLLGMKLDEVKEFETTLPEDFHNKSVAGKLIKFHLELKEIKVQQLPELNNDLAKEISEYETLEQLKQQIRNGIEKRRRRDGLNEEKSKIFDELVQRTEFEIPQSLLNKQAKYNVARHVERSIILGESEENIKENREQIFQKASEKSIPQVKGALILERIAEKENIEVTEQELNQRLEELAAARNMSTDEFKKLHKERGHLNELHDQMFYDKVMGFLHERAVKK